MMIRKHVTQFMHSLLLCLFLICLGTHSLAEAPLSEAQKKERLEKLKSSITKLKSELEKTKSSRASLLKSLETTEKAIGTLNQKAENIEGKIDERKNHLNNLKEEKSQLHEKKTKQQSHVSKHISAAYRLGTQSNIRLLLNQQDPTTVSRNLKYYDYLVKARAQIIADYTTTIDRINKIEPEIAYETEQLQSNFKHLKKEKDELQSAQNNRQTTIAKLNRSIANKDQELKSLHNDRQRLEKLFTRVSEYIDDIKLPSNASNFASLKGELPWPTRGRVKHQYGSRRADGKMRWEGMMIDAKAGAPVSAVHHGRIVFSDYLRGHGLLIIIDHGGGFMSLYAHNQTLYKELGEWVEAGETIASVGNSGGLESAALYFQLRHKGRPTNPKKWFRSA